MQRPMSVLLWHLLACSMAGCYGDDPGDEPGQRVEFISFLDSGVFREHFVDTAFGSGEMAFDVLGESANIRSQWFCGPGQDLILATDSDVAPYPNPMLPRKTAPHDGRLDKRYWVQFAGGIWRSLGIEVDLLMMLRASSDPPSFFPQTVFMWCPHTRPCMTWQAAVMAREVICWTLDTTGFPRQTSSLQCLAYHPRMHWRINACDDCDLPAVADELVVEPM